jgi:hypothetical protein
MALSCSGLTHTSLCPAQEASPEDLILSDRALMVELQEQMTSEVDSISRAIHRTEILDPARRYASSKDLHCGNPRLSTAFVILPN